MGVAYSSCQLAWLVNLPKLLTEICIIDGKNLKRAEDNDDERQIERWERKGEAEGVKR